jgi:hypothetical protein
MCCADCGVDIEAGVTQADVGFELALVTLIGLELLLCQRGWPAYLRAIVPLYRRIVPVPASQAPCETWLDDADDETRHLFAKLAFRRLSLTEVGFWEPWRAIQFAVPVFIAGRIVERGSGRLEVLAGPRWFIPIVWTWAFLGPGPQFDTPIPILLGIAILGAGALHYVRISMLAKALGQGSEGVRGRTTRS